MIALAVILIGPPRVHAADFELEIGVKPGLQFDRARFEVSPGMTVAVRLVNDDEMAHNIIFTQPGSRMAVVNAAMLLGADGPAKGYVPESDDVIAASRLLNPDESDTIEFTAPETPGIYPYVCTFPGHGMLMYGAMYVGVEMPKLSEDMNIPAMARMADEPRKSFHAWGEKRPLMYRIFMPDAGPAAIAVALEHAQSYCWDAGECRLRYAWRGGFLDPWPVWKGNGNGLAKIEGEVWWRAGDAHPLRVGDPDVAPTVEFLGYRKIEGRPEFRYRVNGVLIRELIREQHHGGLTTEFSIEATDEPVMYVAEGTEAASFASSVGTFEEGRLLIDASSGATFSITLTPAHGNGGAH